MRAAAGLLVLCFSLIAATAQAHDSRPLFIEVTEGASGGVTLLWRTPPSIPPNAQPDVTLPDCAPLTQVAISGEGIGRRLYRCPDDLGGIALAIEYPGANPSISSLLRVIHANGETATVLAGPGESRILLPDEVSTLSVLRDYIALGIEHILGGIDHLLFVACLVLIAGTIRRTIVTVTGFTLAHSVTLSLAALDVVRLPTPPVEAAIALSIVLLARELLLGPRNTLTWRRPIVVAGFFGLLHGFGFASALREIGLPQSEIPTALFAFNLGVEVGQIAFVIVFMAALGAVRSITVSMVRQHDRRALQYPGFIVIAGYAIGVFATFWTFDRMLEL
jgi:hydrogenase/urease accessory protein HupE